MVQPVLKDCSLGYVKPMEYRYDNTWTVDMVKKDIATAILTPKYSLTLSEDAEMNLKHEVWDMVKKTERSKCQCRVLSLYHERNVRIFLAGKFCSVWTR